MVGKKIQKAFNDQCNAELYSAYLYLSMAAYFEDQRLPGFAIWMRCQAQEEMIHGMKFFLHLRDRSGRILMAPIEGPPVKWESPTAAFEDALTHERKVTGLINGLVDLAILEKDHAANSFLQWFVNEQVEEEASVQEVLDKLALAKDAPGGMMLLDKDLALRTFVYPPMLTALPGPAAAPVA